MSRRTQMVEWNDPNQWDVKQENFGLEEITVCDRCGMEKRDDTPFRQAGWIKTFWTGEDVCISCQTVAESELRLGRYRLHMKKLERARQIAERQIAELENRIRKINVELKQIDSAIFS